MVEANPIHPDFKHPAVLPVVHVEDKDQTIRNVDIAISEGADGVFLIDHDYSRNQNSEFLFDLNSIVRGEFENIWTGVNCLRKAPKEIFQAVLEAGHVVDGIWADNAAIGVGDLALGEEYYPERVNRLRKQYPLLQEIKYFGGVAMKGLGYVSKPVASSLLAKAAVKYVDVVTTSGSQTGVAAAPEKIKAMKEAIGPRPLGIASGVSKDNVAEYIAAGADAFLVASSIEITSGEFDRYAVRALIKTVRQLAAEVAE